MFGNRIVTAGGAITADEIIIASGNGVGAALDGYDTVPNHRALARGIRGWNNSYIRNSAATALRRAMIFTAPVIISVDNVALDPAAATGEWILTKTAGEISLRAVNHASLIILR